MLKVFSLAIQLKTFNGKALLTQYKTIAWINIYTVLSMRSWCSDDTVHEATPKPEYKTLYKYPASQFRSL